MKDYVGQEITVGAKVVHGRGGRYGGLNGPYWVTGFTDHFVRISRDPGTTKDRKAAPDCLVVVQQYHNTPTVVCLLANWEWGFLAVRRNNEPGKGLLGLPGGYQMAGETWQQCGVRELAEETGYTVDPRDLRMVSMETDEYGNNLVVAVVNGPSFPPDKGWKGDGEAVEVVKVTRDTPETEWAFPRHYAAVQNA